MTQQVEETKDQIEKALNEIDGVESDQMIFRIDNETFRFKQDEYKIIENYRDAFDIEMMEHRFTDYLLKYDYIVGDIAYEKLRLRGFYDEHRKGIPLDMKITFLEDYLLEYCNFGGQYFVFERVEKKEADPESYFKRSNKPNQKRRSNSRRRSNRGKSANPNQNQNQKQNQKRGNVKEAPKRTNQKNTQNQKSTQNKQSKPNKPRTQTAQKEFQVVKKQEPKVDNTQAKPKAKPVPKKNAPKKQFEIRKKTD